MSFRATLPAGKALYTYVAPVGLVTARDAARLCEWTEVRSWHATEWQITRNERIYRFLLLRDEFEVDEFQLYVWRERLLSREIRWGPDRPSTFIRNFTEHVLTSLMELGYLEVSEFAGKQVYKVTAKPSKRVIIEVCRPAYFYDPA